MKLIDYLNERVNMEPTNLLVFAHQIKKFAIHLEKDVIRNNKNSIKTSLSIIQDNLNNLKKELQ